KLFRQIFPKVTLLRQFADADVFEFDRGAFRFQTEITGLRLGAVSARNLLAVHPQSQFSVDGPAVIVVPLADASAEILTRKAARAVGRERRERIQLFFSYGAEVAVGGEPVALLPPSLLLLLREAPVHAL